MPALFLCPKGGASTMMFDIINKEAEVAEGIELDTIFILKDGKSVEMEVPDDVEDDQA
jgi:hypothetical protein